MFFLLSFALCLISTQSAWEKISDGPWSAREGLMGVVFQNNIYLSGGRYNTRFSNDLWRLDNPTSANPKWTPLPTPAWGTRAYHIMLATENFMYILGGQNWTHFYNDVWRTADGQTWTNMLADGNTSTWAPRAGHAGCVLSNKLIIAGGSIMPSPRKRFFYNDVWSSADGQSWTMLTKAAAWSPRSGPRMLPDLSGNGLVLVGGEHGFSASTQYGDVWKSADGANWDLVTSEPGWSNRSGHGLVEAGKSLYVLAGFFDLHDLWQSTDNGKTWKEIDTACWNCARNSVKCGRYDFWSLAYHDEKSSKNWLFAFGGDVDYTTFGGELKDTWRMEF